MPEDKVWYPAFITSIIPTTTNLAMETLQDLSQHLHRIQADAKMLWSEDSHDTYVENGEVIECSNCGGGQPKATYCYQHHLQKLITCSNGPGYLKAHSE